MNKYLKATISSVVFSFVLLLPMLILVVINTCIPNQYDKTFLAGLSPKYQRLYSVEEPKIVIIGGSNLAFGIDSKLLGEQTGYPCVNFGLYADLGTKAMLELSEDAINEGDIIVICPETDPQTYSLYFNGESMWRALESDVSMIRHFETNDVMSILSAFPGNVRTKYNFMRSGTTPEQTDVYNPENLNEYGDIVYPKEYNEMGILKHKKENPIKLTSELISEDFTDYLNRYAKKAEKRGAKVYFSFPPMNALAVENNSVNSHLEFYKYLSDELDFEIISSIPDYIMHEDYFYDTNYHLTNSGTRYRTLMLASDIRRALGDTSSHPENILPTAIKKPSEKKDNEFSKNDDKTGFFEYSEAETDGTKYLILTGLTEKGCEEELLVLPVSKDGLPIISVAENAFSKSSRLERIFVSDISNIQFFSDGAFDNCPTLRRVELTVPSDSLTVSQNIFGESASNVNFYVPLDMYAQYITDYNWGSVSERIKGANF